MIVAGRGIDRDKGNDLAVDLYIDLINAVAQILIVMRRDTVIFQQAFFKPGHVPRSVIAAVGIPQPRRAHDGFHGLDNSAVHPESYHIVERMAADAGVTVDRLLADKELRRGIKPERYVDGQVGIPTVTDIVEALDK